MPGLKQRRRLSGFGHALRRVVGLVVLALFAHTTVSSAWMDCHASRSDATMPAGMDMSNHSTSTEPDAPRSPADDHGADCDHPIPVTNCGVGGACVVAVLTPAAIALPTADPVARPFLDPTGSPLALSIAPDVPPPRA